MTFDKCHEYRLSAFLKASDEPPGLKDSFLCESEAAALTVIYMEINPRYGWRAMLIIKLGKASRRNVVPMIQLNYK